MDRVEGAKSCAVSTKSLSFIRPIYYTLKHTDKLLIVEVLYSRQGGNSDIKLFYNFQSFLYFLKYLPEKALVKYTFINKPNMNNIGLKSNNLEYGVY